MQTHRQGRIAMLGALTQPHRELLARVVGELAIAPEPDIDAAATQLDAALTPAEVQTIGRIQGDLRDRLVTQFSQLHTRMEHSLTPEQVKQLQNDGAALGRAFLQNGQNPAITKLLQTQNDPGHALLTAVLSGMQPYAKLIESPR